MATTQKIDPGVGYRLLGRDEIIERGDEYCGVNDGFRSRWFATYRPGMTPRQMNNTYRRKVSIQPRKLEPTPRFDWETVQPGDFYMQPGIGYILCDLLVGQKVGNRQIFFDANTGKRCEKPVKHRPFANLQEACAWVAENGTTVYRLGAKSQIGGVDSCGVSIEFHEYVCFEALVRDFTWNGNPVGVRVGA